MPFVALRLVPLRTNSRSACVTCGYGRSRMPSIQLKTAALAPIPSVRHHVTGLAAEDGWIDEVRDRPAEICGLGAAQRRDHSRRLPRPVEVDAHDSRVRVRAAEHGHVDGAGQPNVVDVFDPAGEEPVSVLLALTRADVAPDFRFDDGRHSPPSISSTFGKRLVSTATRCFARFAYKAQPSISSRPRRVKQLLRRPLRTQSPRFLPTL